MLRTLFVMSVCSSLFWITPTTAQTYNYLHHPIQTFDITSMSSSSPYYQEFRLFPATHPINRGVSLNGKGMRIVEVAKHIEKATGIPIVVSPNIANRTADIRCKDCPATFVLENLAKEAQFAIAPHQQGLYLREFQLEEVNPPSHVKHTGWAMPASAYQSNEYNSDQYLYESAVYEGLGKPFVLRSDWKPEDEYLPLASLMRSVYLFPEKQVPKPFKALPVRELLKSLSQQTGIYMRLSPKIPEHTPVNITGGNITFATAIAHIASEVGAVIVPEREGIVLYPPNQVQINHNLFIQRSHPMPWSATWLRFPAFKEMLNQPKTRQKLISPEMAMRGTIRMSERFYQQFQSHAPTTTHNPLLKRVTQGRITLLDLGRDRFAVAETGKGEKGEQGHYVTLYRWTGKQLQIMGRRFQASPKQDNAPQKTK